MAESKSFSTLVFSLGKLLSYDPGSVSYPAPLKSHGLILSGYSLQKALVLE